MKTNRNLQTGHALPGSFTESRLISTVERDALLKHVSGLTSSLYLLRNAGVIVLPDGDNSRSPNRLTKLKNGLNEWMIKDPTRVLRLPAEGTVQGNELNEEQTDKVLLKIERLKKIHRGKGLILLQGMRFSGAVGYGTKEIADTLLYSMKEDRKSLETALAQGWTGRRSNNYMVLAVGSGEKCDLPSSEDFAYGVHEGFAESLAERWALTANGTLLPAGRPDIHEISAQPVQQTAAVQKEGSRDWLQSKFELPFLTPRIN